MTKIILQPRRSGKTTELIRMSDGKKGYIVCHDKNAADAIFRHAKKIGCDINYPLTWEDIVKKNYYAKGVREIYVDNFDLLWHRFAPDLEWKAVTFSVPENNE